MKKLYIIIITFIVIGMSGTFMPWVYGNFGFLGEKTIYGKDGDGLITLFIFFILLVMTLLQLKKKVFTFKYRLFGILLSLFIFCFGIWKMYTFYTLRNEVFSPEGMAEVLGTMPDFLTIHLGIGVYIITLASLGVLCSIIYAYYFIYQKQKNHGDIQAQNVLKDENIDSLK